MASSLRQRMLQDLQIAGLRGLGVRRPAGLVDGRVCVAWRVCSGGMSLESAHRRRSDLPERRLGERSTWLLEPGLEVRLRGLQSILVRRSVGRRIGCHWLCPELSGIKFTQSSLAPGASFDHDPVMAKARKKSRPIPPSRRRPQSDAALAAALKEWPDPVQKASLVVMLKKHVARLRGEDPAHGNRALFLDDVFIAYLLAFFNPSIRTLRTIEDFSQTRQAQKHLSIPKICRSTLSDFQKIADPERLEPVIEALRSELERKCRGGRLPADLAALERKILAVDGTFLSAAAEVAWAVQSRNQRADGPHKARLDWQVDIATWLPEVVAVPDPGESEPDAAARQVAAGTISIYDRAFLSFHLVASYYSDSAAAGATPEPAPRAEFVIRLKQPGGNAPTLEEVEVLPLDDQATAAGVTSDRLVRMPGLEKSQGLRVTLREVVVDGSDGKPVRLLTNLLRIPAHVIAPGVLINLK